MDDLTKKIYSIVSQHVFEYVKKEQPFREDEWIRDKIHEARLFDLVDQIIGGATMFGSLICKSGEKTDEHSALSRAANNIVRFCDLDLPVTEKFHFVQRVALFLSLLVKVGNGFSIEGVCVSDSRNYLTWIMGAAIGSCVPNANDAMQSDLNNLLLGFSEKIKECNWSD